MKHVIIIETIDGLKGGFYFEKEVEQALESIIEAHFGAHVVWTKFYQESAIDAILERYGMNREGFSDSLRS